jgi:long-subunit fatty acid transport protein
MSPSYRMVDKAEASGWTLGVNAHWNLSDTWYISGRTGLIKADIKGNFLDSGYSYRVNDHSTKGYAGVGVGYDFSDKFGIGLNYDRYKAGNYGLDLETGVASVSGEVRF